MGCTFEPPVALVCDLWWPSGLGHSEVHAESQSEDAENAEKPSTNNASICRWPIGVVDYQEFHRAFGGVDFQAGRVLKRG